MRRLKHPTPYAIPSCHFYNAGLPIFDVAKGRTSNDILESDTLEKRLTPASGLKALTQSVAICTGIGASVASGIHA